ncbi:MAG: glycosyltransferase [Leptolyngbya sp. SIO1E4]|nr:glycosyltransferase [Leptolyngbya sp. SIO1E4]
MSGFLSSKALKFLIGGAVAAGLNLVLIFLMIEKLDFSSAVLRNTANAISMEFSLIASFLIYKFWVWPGGSWKIKDLICKQLLLYHFSAGVALLLRIFIIFPVLDWLEINYIINTLVGIVASATINYIISDSLVFNSSVPVPRNPAPRNNKFGHLGNGFYPPEGLGPALLQKSKPLVAKEGYGCSNMLSIIIPAHNEEGCIVSTVNAIADTMTAENIHYEIVVVNDNSRDRTGDLLHRLSLDNDNLRYINNYYPNGFGFAIRCGLENFRGDAVAIVMADGSDSPADIVRYYYQLQKGYDCVFGSRFIKGGRVVDYPLHKLIINRLANLFIQIIFGLRFNDFTNAFKIYRREVIEGISPLISHHFNLTVEIPLKAVVRGYSYSVMPIFWQNRQTGVSKLKIKEMGSRYLFIVLCIWLEKMLSRGDYHRSNDKRMARING